MNPARVALFRPLKDAIEQREMFDYDFLEIVAGFTKTQPEIAEALCLHCSAFLRTNGPDEMQWQTIIAEVYRRAFYEDAPGPRYGLMEWTDEQCGQFTEHMVGLLSMDARQTAADQGIYHAPPTGHQ